MNQFIKYARLYIAKNQIKRLKQYLYNELPDVQKVQETIDKIQKQSFNFIWFAKRFILQNKHIEDIDDILQMTMQYSKLNKDIRKFPFGQNDSFSDFYLYMKKFMQNKQNKDTVFHSPKYCKLILSEGGYNFYYADANDKKCYQELHELNKLADGTQYAMWCVVNGTQPWGRYTDSQFPFYVYVTDSNNKPIMLFNLGYDNDAQIKDIHNNAYTHYSQQLIQFIQKIAQKYKFQINDTCYDSDYRSLLIIKNYRNKKCQQNQIQKIKHNFKCKHNNLYCVADTKIHYNAIYDISNGKLAYIFKFKNIIPFNGYKLNNQDMIAILTNMDEQDTIYSLLLDRYVDQQNKKLFDLCCSYVSSPNYLLNLMQQKIITDKQIILNLFQRMIDAKGSSLRIPCKLIGQKIITDKEIINNFVEYVISQRMERGGVQAVRYLIKYKFITDKNVIDDYIKFMHKQHLYRDLAQIFQYITDKKSRLDIIEWSCRTPQPSDLIEKMLCEKEITDETEIIFILQNIALFNRIQQSYLYKQIINDNYKNKQIITQLTKYILELHSGSDKQSVLFQLLSKKIIDDQELLWKIADWFDENDLNEEIYYLYQKGKLDKKYTYKRDSK